MKSNEMFTTITGHLSPFQLDLYHRRAISPDEEQAIYVHLSQCSDCRKTLIQLDGIDDDLNLFFEELEIESLSGLIHLDDEQLIAYVQNDLEETDRIIADSHLEVCRACNAQVHELSAFNIYLISKLQEQVTPTKTDGSWRTRSLHALSLLHWQLNWQPSHWFATPGIIAFVIITGALLVLFAMAVSNKPPSYLAQNEIDIALPAEREDKVQLDTTKTTEKLSSSKVIPSGTINQSNRSVTSSHLESRQDRLPKKIVKNKGEGEIDSTPVAMNINVPGVITDFDRTPAARRGENLSIKELFTVTSPISTVVLNNRPEFHWTPFAGATSYEVYIYDEELNLVTKSDHLASTYWIIPQNLRSDVTYTWKVVATKNGKEYSAPGMPRRAEFKVLGLAASKVLQRRAERMKSHAALGVVYAEAGLLDEAEREFRLHLTESPADRRVQNLLQEVLSWRQRN